MILDVVLCIFGIAILQVITPWWWWIIVLPFVVGTVRARSGVHGFLLGSLSCGILWLLASVFQYFTGSQIIARRVALMFGVGAPFLLVIITTLIAAISGGLAASTGHAIRQIVLPAETRR